MRKVKTIKQVCEVCWNKPATSMTFDRAHTEEWYYSCNHCLSCEYSVEFNRFKELDWFKHLIGKNWVNTPKFIVKFSWAYRQIVGIDFSEQELLGLPSGKEDWKNYMDKKKVKT